MRWFIVRCVLMAVYVVSPCCLCSRYMVSRWIRLCERPPTLRDVVRSLHFDLLVHSPSVSQRWGNFWFIQCARRPLWDTYACAYCEPRSDFNLLVPVVGSGVRFTLWCLATAARSNRPIHCTSPLPPSLVTRNRALYILQHCALNFNIVHGGISPPPSRTTS